VSGVELIEGSCAAVRPAQVPRTMTNITSHPVAGMQRVNLTFRRLKPEFEKSVPRWGTAAVSITALVSSASSCEHGLPNKVLELMTWWLPTNVAVQAAGASAATVPF